MNTEEMYTSINKGVPNYIILDIDITTLLNECASDKEQLIKEQEYLIRQIKKSIF